MNVTNAANTERRSSGNARLADTIPANISSAEDPFYEIKRNRSRLAHFCNGVGVEIGPLHIPTLGLSPGTKVLYMDRASTRELLEYFASNPGVPAESIVPIDVIGDGMSFPFRDGALDFLIAHHVLEHLANPLKALTEWHRCLREAGILYLSLPDKRFCAFCAGPNQWIYPDARRQLTTWEHLLDDYRRDDKGDSEDSREHARDIVRYVEGAPAEEVESRVDSFLASKPDYHYHTWTYESLLGAIDRCSSELGIGFSLEAHIGSYETAGEMIVVLRKSSSQRNLLPVTHRYPEWNVDRMDWSLGELLPGHSWEQSFVTTRDGLSRIDIRFGTFARRNDGRLVFRLYSEELAEPLTEEEVDLSDLRDNCFRSFEISGVAAAAAERRFRITLEATNSVPGSAVTVWCADIDDASLQLSVNGRLRTGAAINFKAFVNRTLEAEAAWSGDGSAGEASARRREQEARGADVGLRYLPYRLLDRLPSKTKERLRWLRRYSWARHLLRALRPRT